MSGSGSMRVSVGFMGFGGLAETIPVVMAAEQHGLDGVWTAEHIGHHDAMVPSAVYLSKTQRLEIGLIGLSTAGRHPGLTAMELMSMSELAPGRIRCQVGPGADHLVATLGRKVSKPVANTRVFITSLREAMAGRDMRIEYPEFSFNGFRMQPLGPVPAIDVMGIRPKMVQMSAREADGLSISVGASLHYIRDIVGDVTAELEAAGRDRSAFRITAHAVAAVGNDLDARRAQLGMMMSTFPQGPAGFLARGVIDAEEHIRVEQEKGPAGLMKLWTPDKIDQIAFIASPDMLEERLSEYAATGIDELSLMLIDSPDTQPEIVRQLAAARQR